MQRSPAGIYEQFNRALPLEIGFDRSLAGTPATRLTTPIPPVYSYPTMVPVPTANPSFDDVVTKSMMPALVTTQVASTASRKPIVEQVVEPRVELPEQCHGPAGLCPPEANQRLFDLLVSKGPGIACACDPWEFYRMTNPTQGTFKWKFDEPMIVRNANASGFDSTDQAELFYSRWGPKSGAKGAPKLLLLHDVLDCRKTWWCTQKMLSPFMDTVSIDLLGSGESTKPRSLNRTADDESETMPFPWSYELHARYLLDLAQILWPGEKFFVAGVGWGAQIAAVMASMASDVLDGIMMVNPPGFGTDIHPEFAYVDISQLAAVKSELDLANSHVSFVGRVRSSILLSLSSSDSGHGGRDAATSTALKLILEQYTDLDRQAVLLEQFIAIGRLGLLELPRTKENENGLDVENITCPVMIVSGGNDLVYPPEHRNLYPAIYYSTMATTLLIPDCGHLIHLENPKVLAEIILDFIRSKVGFAGLKDAFIGFVGASQGNEKALVEGLKDIYLL